LFVLHYLHSRTETGNSNRDQYKNPIFLDATDFCFYDKMDWLEILGVCCMEQKDKGNIHLVRRVLVPLLIVTLPIAAAIAYLLYYKQAQRSAEPASIASGGGFIRK
jgi:hypothetical protein